MASQTGKQWDPGLHRSFLVAGRTVWVRLETLYEADGAPRWAISWLPSVPPRLTKADMASFDEQAAKAKAAILAYVETLA